jgi:paxillin
MVATDEKVSADYLKVADNSSFKKCLSKNKNDGEPEVLLFSDIVWKINKRTKRQKRCFVVTTAAVYNFHPKKLGSFKRRIMLRTLGKLFLAEGATDEFMLQTHSEYDYRMVSGRRQEIIDVISNQYKVITNSELDVMQMQSKHIAALMTTKDEVRAQGSTKSTKGRKPSEKDKEDKGELDVTRGSSILGVQTREDAVGGAGWNRTSDQALISKELTSLLNILKGKKSKAGADLAKAFDRKWPTVGGDAAVLAKPDESTIQLFCELLALDQKSNGFMTNFASNLGNVKTMYVTLVTCLDCMEEPVRYWALKSLWYFLPLFSTSGPFKPNAIPATEFTTCILPTMSRYQVAKSDYLALLELMLNTVSKPSEGGQKEEVEAFGKKIEQPEVLSIILRLLSNMKCDWKLREMILKDLNVLMLRREENLVHLLEVPDWQLHLLPQLSDVPVSADKRDETQEQIFKYVVNLFAMLHLHAFVKSNQRTETRASRQKSVVSSSGGRVTVRDLVGGSISCLRTYAQWDHEAVKVARSMYGSLLAKIDSKKATFKFDMERQEWGSLWTVLELVEDFMFYQPVDTATDKRDSSTPSSAVDENNGNFLLSQRPNWQTNRRPGASIKGRTRHNETADSSVDLRKGELGIHLDPLKSTCEDAGLAKRVLALLNNLGMKDNNAANSGAMMNKGERDTRKRGTQVVNAFKDYLALYQHIDKAQQGQAGGEEEQMQMMLKVSMFLENRKKKGAASMFSGSNKRKIVRKLHTNMVRQQAQQIVRAQVQAAQCKIETVVVETTVETKEDDKGHVVSHVTINVALIGCDDEDVDRACAGCSETVPSSNAVSACGKYWHAEHFTCGHCETPFSKFENQYCKDEHDNPVCRNGFLEVHSQTVCGGCLEPFKSGDSALSAVGLRWHSEHFCCAQCSVKIEIDDQFFEADHQPYCKSCYTISFNTCPTCNKVVEEAADAVVALGKNWHKDHFECAACSLPLAGGEYFTMDKGDGKGEKPYCESDYLKLFVPKCKGCDDYIMGDGIEACGAFWHEEHFNCTHCHCDFDGDSYFEHDDRPYCEEHYFELFGQKCAGCGEVITDDTELHALDKSWHEHHFKCTECKEPLDVLDFRAHEDKPYCVEHYMTLFGKKCGGCGEFITDGNIVDAVGKSWHPHHLVCVTCSKQVGIEGADVFRGKVRVCLLRCASFRLCTPHSHPPIWHCNLTPILPSAL